MLMKLRHQQKKWCSNNCKTWKKSNQKEEMCEYKINTGSDGNIMPIKMSKALFPHTIITDKNKSKYRKILHAYNISCIPQMAHARSQ